MLPLPLVTARSSLPRTARLAVALLGLGALALLPGVASADIFTYTDAEGTVHFANKPKADGKYTLYLKSPDRKRATIAGVTAVLKDLLDSGLIEHRVTDTLGQGVTVSAAPPDTVVVSGDEAGPRLNLFMYQATPNAALRNQALPSVTGRGARSTNPPLALDLHYLLTAYGVQELQAEVLARYQARGAEVVDTARCGAAWPKARTYADYAECGDAACKFR